MDAASIVRSEVARIPGAKQSQVSTFIPCPFHAEKTPSCRVWHDSMRLTFAGNYKCFGCGVTGKWNDLASKFGLQRLESSGYTTQTEVPVVNLDYLEKSFTSSSNSRKLKLYSLSKTNCERIGLKVKDDQFEWRGFKVDFLESVGAKIAFDYFLNGYFIYLPVSVAGSVKGYILARVEKVEGETSYINKPGQWSQKSGLYPFDSAIELMRKLQLKTLVLVEGPRDALRLIHAQIPAVAILGTQSWTSHKASLGEHAGVERIVVCFDGDRAGKEAARLVLKGQRKKQVGGKEEVVQVPNLKVLNEIYSEVKLFPLWKKAPGKEYDPGNMPSALVEDLRQLLI